MTTATIQPRPLAPERPSHALTHPTLAPRLRAIPEAELAEHERRLDQDGYTVIRDLVDRDTTAKLRAVIDHLRGDQAGGMFRPPFAATAMPGGVLPGTLMADAVSDAHVDLARRLLRADDPRLLEQVLVCTPRTDDPSPGLGWHLDGVFYPRHRAARPRQTYYQFIHALSDIEHDGGATRIVPGSHRLAYAAAARIGEQGERIAMADQQELRAEILRLAGIDAAQAVEILADEGDLYVFDPMCLHTASHNHRERSRYVFFQTFVDASATEIIGTWRDTNYPRRFSAAFRERLPAHRRSLMDADNLEQEGPARPWTP